MVRRLKLERFTQLETTELVQQVLGGRVNLSSAATMHAQAEGVAFIVEELARSYRETGLIQEIDGAWTLVRNAARLLPSGVRTLIQRRAARLPVETKDNLADAAILGRSFSLKDLRWIKVHLGADEEGCTPTVLAESLATAVQWGLLEEYPPGSPADYRFTHNQIREFAAAMLTAARRRAIHRAIVDMLSAGGDPPPESMSLLSHHALAGGDPERAVRFSISAAQAALESRAAEETLRVVDQALPAASAAHDRVALLTSQDDALGMLRRSADRVEGLAELAALAEALGDSHLELDVKLRRAAALRVSEEEDQAAELALSVREAARERGDRAAELAACLELGQDLLRSPLGESFSAPSEVDLEGAAEAYRACLRTRRGVGRRCRSRGRAARARGHLHHPGARVVHGARPDRRGRRDHGAGRRRRHSRRDPRRHADSSPSRRGRRALRARDRALRPDRRPSRRDVGDHRPGVRQFRHRPPHSRCRAEDRGDPATVRTADFADA